MYAWALWGRRLVVNKRQQAQRCTLIYYKKADLQSGGRSAAPLHTEWECYGNSWAHLDMTASPEFVLVILGMWSTVVKHTWGTPWQVHWLFPRNVNSFYIYLSAKPRGFLLPNLHSKPFLLLICNTQLSMASLRSISHLLSLSWSMIPNGTGLMHLSLPDRLILGPILCLTHLSVHPGQVWPLWLNCLNTYTVFAWESVMF